ncbi:MAG: ADP-ribosylglycohydrolase family protein, partial [Armatimonadota bacterium]|nr:ADP-ribosylglycohydrolase family protein [Armatimonadota bacterium]
MTEVRVLLTGVLLLAGTAGWAAPKPLRLPVSAYRDRMAGGWIGQMAGVAWGAPTEFKFRDQIIPEEKMPAWRPELINGAYGQDDLYVEMTFLRTLEEHGLDVSIRQAGIDFANTRYPLWCANRAGRTNLRRGIAPPDSGHPRFNRCPNDIDYQIEADFSGLIAPGLPQVAVEMGEKFGRLMNYGDGVYAGQFVGGMYAAAFFEQDRIRVVEAGLRCIPPGCQYAEMVRDLLRWYRENPSDWQETWRRCQRKYREDPEYQKASNGGIDCKINGAYVLLGLLYGNGDPDATITIACRAGQDSDCNPSTAAGVLFTMMGESRLPLRFTAALDRRRTFHHTPYTFTDLLRVCEKLAREVVVRAGGKVERNVAGEEVFVIPSRAPVPSQLELSWAPGPIANSRFTADEMKQIKYDSMPHGIKDAVAKVAPGWEIKDCGPDM